MYDDWYDFSELDLRLECQLEDCDVLADEGVKTFDKDGLFYCSVQCLQKDRPHGRPWLRSPHIYFTIWDHSKEDDYHTLYREFRWKK